MKTYEEIRDRPPDFVVKYSLYAPSEGGRKVTFQHLRCDFMYHGDDPKVDGISMIHPEFLGDNGVPVGDEMPVSPEGHASMWILIPAARKAHQSRIQIGTRGYFMEGSRKIGEVVVEKTVGLYENPA